MRHPSKSRKTERIVRDIHQQVEKLSTFYETSIKSRKTKRIVGDIHQQVEKLSELYETSIKKSKN